MTIPAGSRLGPYEILAPLGAGGMGEVYRARDERLAREVAIKVLPAALAGDPERLRRFEKEARSASALNHPNIVTIYDIGSSGGISYIAMERVEGATLRELLAGGPLPSKRLLQIAPQIADGLAKAHEAGIVHRDLKPENVMVTKDGLVKILDFGLAKLTSTMSGSGEGSQLPTMTGTTPGVVVGTVGYMSPEQASGEVVDFRSDQFSFGSILYEMGTGRRAFQGKKAIDVLAAILNSEPEPMAAINPETPPPLRWIAERCLAKEPEGRYASTKDLARELATLRDHLSEASLSGTAILPAPRRRSWRWPITGLAALLAVTVLAVSAGRSIRSAPQTRFRQLTFHQGSIQTAMFAPDGQTIVFGAVRNGKPQEILSTRVGSFESRSLGLPSGDILSISPSSEMAILLTRDNTLARAPLGGGTPREILANVNGADWSPDGSALAVVHQVGGKNQVEFPIGKILYEGVGFIGNPRFSPKGDRIAFNEGFKSLALVDLKGSRTTFPTQGLTGYAWSRSGEEIWFSEVFGGVTRIQAVMPSGRKRLVASLPAEFRLDDISRDGGLLMERFALLREMAGLLPGDTRERDVAGLAGSVPVDISADGKLVLFSEIGAGGGPTGGVYLWKADSSQSVRLGDGIAQALSPDGLWALAMRLDSRSSVFLLPTGAGESRSLPLSGVSMIAATFFPDGKKILISGHEAGREIRLYALDIEGGKPRPVGPEGATFTDGAHGVSPDGKLIAASGPDGKIHLYPTEGGVVVPPPIPGAVEGQVAIRWCGDGRRLFVPAEGGKIYRVDPSSGKRELWNEFRSAEGLLEMHNVLPTPDGKWYVYGHNRSSSDLFLAEGLK